MSDSPEPNLERSFFWGVIFMAILYGIEVYLYFHSVYLWRTSPALKNIGLGAYIFLGGLMLALITIGTFVDMVFMEFMWIDFRTTFGDPLGYLAANSAIWWQTLGTTAGSLAGLIGDALLLYRCYIVWNKSLRIIVGPLIIYLASTAMVILTIIQSAAPGSNFFNGTTVNFATPQIALATGFNASVTGIILYRLFEARMQLRAVLPQEAAEYTGPVAILVESALPYTVFGIITAVVYGKNLDEGPAFLFIWSIIGVLVPQAIIYRVALGRAWNTDTMTHFTSRMEFTSVPPASETYFSSGSDNESAGAAAIREKKQRERSSSTLAKHAV